MSGGSLLKLPIQLGLPAFSGSKEQMKKPAFESRHMRTTFITLDKALEWVGDNSRFQKRVIYVLSVQWILMSFFTMGMAFFFQKPQLICYNPLNPSETKICEEKEACESTYYYIDYDNSAQSIATEFGLVCNDKYLVGLVGSAFYLGAGLGGFIFPHISDRHGRRIGLLVAVGIGGVCILGCVLMKHISLIIIFFSLIGWALNGFETLSLVYVAEVSAQKFRNYSSVTLTSVWAAAQLLLSPLSLFIPRWRIFMGGCIGFPLLITFIYTYKFLPETPRFLVSRNRFKEAKQALDNISTFNKRPNFEWLLEGEMEEYNKKTLKLYPIEEYQQKLNEKQQQEIQEQNHKNQFKFKKKDQNIDYGYNTLFKYPSLKNKTVKLSIMWFNQYFVYYGLAFSLDSLGSELHLSLLFFGLSETIACLISAPIKVAHNRIQSFIVSMIIMTFGCFFLVFFPVPQECLAQNANCYQSYVNLLLATVITFSLLYLTYQLKVVKFGITIFKNVLITYTTEVYPTPVRSLGFGWNMTVGRFGNTIMPMFVANLEKNGVNPLIPFGGLGVLNIFVSRKLQETFKQEIPDYIEEAKDNEVPLLENYRYTELKELNNRLS